MQAKVHSCAIIGLCGEIVEVEVDLSNEPASFTIKGTSRATFTKTEERVRSAIQNSGYLFPSKGITVYLVPAHLPKESTAFDLPIALGVLLASGQINPKEHLDESLFLGEISLDGSLRSTNGVLPLVSSMPKDQVHSVFIPAANAFEASLVGGNMIFPVEKLSELLNHLNGEKLIMPFTPDTHIFDDIGKVSYKYDMAKVRGQEHVKRALEIAASGMHNILLRGPRGAGKMDLARCIPSILPQLTIDETLEITKIYSVSGMLPPSMPLIVQRPFRTPHPSISYVQLLGDGYFQCPGEVSLAHHGVLFLHELSEYEQNTLKELHQPLEEKMITISSAEGTITYPANILLVASMKPCSCGYFGDPVNDCICSAKGIARYQKRFRRYLLDHFDFQVEVLRIDYGKLTDKRHVENSDVIQRRVQAALEQQLERFKNTKFTYNSEMGPNEVRKFCQTDSDGEGLLTAAMQQLHLSAKARQKALKVARTIADLAGSDRIMASHVAEAIQYRLRM